MSSSVQNYERFRFFEEEEKNIENKTMNKQKESYFKDNSFVIE
jgi:hypothetical protein